MSKRSQVPQLPKELSRKQLSRAERDARNSRRLLLGVGGALVLSILLIGFGVLRDNVLLPNEPVAIVGNQTILSREFQQRVRVARAGLQQQLLVYQQLGFTDQINQIQQQLADRQGIGSEVINDLIDEAVYRQSAAELGVNVTNDDVQLSIEEQFNYFRNPPTPEPTRTPAPTPTASATITVTPQPTSTPQPSPTPVSAQGFADLYQQQLSGLASLGMNEADYRHFVEGRLIADKVREVLSNQVVTITDQVAFQYIVSDSQENIDQVQQAITTDGFDSVYGQILSQTFVITQVGASEVPFTPKDTLTTTGQFDSAFADLAFATPISSTFGPISQTNTNGVIFYVGRVFGHEVRELDPSTLDQAKSTRIQEWVTERRQQLGVQTLTWEDRVPGDP